jgi:HK97 family phage major capsid protein
MPENQAMETLVKLQVELDKIGGAFKQYRDAQDERVKQLEESGKVQSSLVEKMAKLEGVLGRLDEVKGEFDSLKTRIDTMEAASKRPGKGSKEERGEDKPYAKMDEFGFADQLRSVHQIATTGKGDPRLDQIKAASGLNETIPSDGGFLVQTDYVSEVLQRAYQLGAISSRVRRIPISANANGLKVPFVNETARTNGNRRGGIRAYWTEEAGEKVSSKPSFGQLELKLHKLVALVYITDELLQDAQALQSWVMMNLPEEINFNVENSFLRGTGAGQPLGILNAGATVTVNPRAGQAAATIIWENIVDMWSRMWAPSQQNAVWLINQDCFPQLATMAQNVGTGGVPVWLPANGAAGQPYSTLMGRPVIPVEYCSTVGTVGDIILVDWSTYLTIDKGGIQAASSMHVRFVYDEMAFRFVYRVDGQPTWQSALTPFQGTNTQSPVIVLDSRT